MYDDTNDELNDIINPYKKDGISNGKYYSLLESVGKFINKYDIDVSIVKKSTLDLINSYYKIKSLNKACFSVLSNNTSTKPIITDEEHENDLRIILKSVIKNNDKELMICTMNLPKKIDENKTNAVATASTTTNTKTPKWLMPLKRTVNSQNNKNLNN